MCQSLTDGLPSEELRGYGINVQTEVCPGEESCWRCHNPQDLRRPVFDKKGNLAYMPVPCQLSFVRDQTQEQLTC